MVLFTNKRLFVRIAVCFALSLVFSLNSNATEYVCGIKVIGGSESEVTSLKKTLKALGWKCCDTDLNIYSGGDFVYLMYRKARLSSTDKPITDFYARIVKKDGPVPSTIEHDGRTYHLVSYDGGSHFKMMKGDLNSGAGGSYINLYYTTDDLPDLQAVTDIEFKFRSSYDGKVVCENGGSSKADFNDGITYATASNNIYMYYYTQLKKEQLIGDVMLVGGPKSAVNDILDTYDYEDWTLIKKDLNTGCGSGSDYIYLLFKPTDRHNNGDFITDFYLSDSENAPDTITHNGRTYALATYDGGDRFREIKGDLNSNAGGDYIHLYYTKDPFPDNRAVYNIRFNDTANDALGRNGSTNGGYDLNQGTQGDKIYMHQDTWEFPETWGDGSKDNPFIIRTQRGWNDFAANVAAGNSYADKYLKLISDLEVTTMVGSEGNPFCGHFDGDGHTLTVNIQASSKLSAPFLYLQDATISSLNVSGTVQGGPYNNVGGLAGNVSGLITITNCNVTASLSSSGKVLHVGGLISEAESNVDLGISNSTFKGSMICPDGYGIGGFLGWADVTEQTPKLTFSDCLFAPQELQVSSSYIQEKSSFAYIRDGKKYGTFNNCYYTHSQNIGTAQGIAVSATIIDDEWDIPLTAIDGQTYYMRSLYSKNLPYTYNCNIPLEEEGWSMRDCLEGTGLGSGVFFFKGVNWYENYLEQCLISPIFDGSVPMKVSFKVKALSSTSKNIFVGYATSIEDNPEIQWTRFYVPTAYNWYEYEASFPLGTRRVFFKAIIGNTFDLTEFSFVPDIYLPPTQLSIKDSGPESFAFGWVAPPTSISETGFAYQYKKASDEEWPDDQIVQEPLVRINGLTPGTDYEFRVRTLYEDHESTMQTIEFHTPTFMELPYDCSFENGMDGLSVVTSVGESPYFYTGITPTNGREIVSRTGEHSFLFYSSLSRHGDQYLKTLFMPKGNAKKITFYYKCGGMSWEEICSMGYSTVGSDPKYFTWLVDRVVASNYNEWKKCEIIIPADAICFAFKYTSKETYGLFIDDLTIEEYSAHAAPKDLTVTEMNQQMSTKLTWKKPDASVTAYAFQYKKSSDNEWSALTVTTATSVILSDLAANKDYFFRVKALYGDESSGFATVNFLSDCGIQQLPFDWSFEDQLGGFRTFNCVRESEVVGFDGAARTGKWSFRFSPTVGDYDTDHPTMKEPQYLISPRFDPVSAIKYSFYYRITTQLGYDFSTSFQVGYSTKTNSIDDFTWGDRIDVSELGWKQYIGYAPVGTKYIAIKWLPKGYFLMLDDMKFEDYAYLEMTDDFRNTNTISTLNGKNSLVTLKNITLHTNGLWSTLCLPFNVDNLKDSPLEGFVVKELDTESIINGHATGIENDTLFLNFKDASSIQAGKPYIFRYGRVKGADAGHLTYQAGNSSPSFNGEEGGKLLDGDTGTKWCTTDEYKYENVWYTYFTASNPVKVTGYTLTTGNDTKEHAGRNPKKWILKARATENGKWETIDSRNVNDNSDDAMPAENHCSKSYTIASDKQGVYRYFNFIVQESGDDIMQLSELKLQGTIDSGNSPDITNPKFETVINSGTPAVISSQDNRIRFVGSYDPLVVKKNGNSVILDLDADTINYAPETIKAFRAHFEVQTGGSPVSRVVINDGENSSTMAAEGLMTTYLNIPETQQDDSWYSIFGIKLNGEPTDKGIYFHNGRKVAR